MISLHYMKSRATEDEMLDSPVVRTVYQKRQMKVDSFAK